MNDKLPLVSVIVLCWNHCSDVTEPFVENFLRTVDLTRQNIELILFNNGSNDQTKIYLESLKKRKTGELTLKIIHSKDNLGFSGGNNEALKFAVGKYVLFMNNDVVMEEGWFEKLISEAREDTVVGADYVNGNSATTFRGVMLPYLNGWCVMFPMKFLAKYGGFSKEFGWAYFEDAELSQRAARVGLKLKGVKLPIRHLGSRSSDQINQSDQFKYNQVVFRNLMYNYEKKDKLRIIFYCPGNYQFKDEDYEGKGVGGAEASLILLTRELAKLGHIVEIYNDTDTEGVFAGVYYYNTRNFNIEDYSDIFILFRNSCNYLMAVNAGVKVFWSCDQATTNDWQIKVIPYVNKTFAISKYHKQYLLGHYPFNKNDIDIVDLGVNKADYEKEPVKIPGKLIFCSVPRRGLKHLHSLYPKIKAKVPHATLTITSDYRLWGAEPENSEFIAMFENTPGVTFLGKIPRSELVKHQLEAEVMAYPCDYDENFCISAMECIAAGAIPVTFDIGAMATTVAESGVVLKGTPLEGKWQDIFIDKVCEFLLNQSLRTEFSNTGRKRALEKYSWDYLAKEQWEKKFLNLLTEMKVKHNYCKKHDIQFSNAYEFAKHRAEEHISKLEIAPDVPVLEKEIFVVIKTTRPVEFSLGSEFWSNVKELRVKHEMSGDVIRILTEAYGNGVVEGVEMDIIDK